jgi:hypothetical protein
MENIDATEVRSSEQEMDEYFEHNYNAEAEKDGDILHAKREYPEMQKTYM